MQYGSLALRQSDISTLHTVLGCEDARKIKALAAAVADFDQAEDKTECAAKWAQVLEPLGVRGLSVPSMYRKAEMWRAGGVIALCDGRMLRRAGCQGLKANDEFIDFWRGLVMSNRRKTAPAYRSLFTQLRAGAAIPGFGDWREIWAADHGGRRPLPGTPCPYRPYSCVPNGWTERNLRRLAPDKFAIAAARRGLGEAQMTALPCVRRTRVGLAPMQCVMVDDMWHEVKVAYEGNRHAQRVVELSAMDVLTGHVVSWMAKPIRERDDGTRETLRTEWMRYLMANLLCDVGITPAGCIILGEHGTAAADAVLRGAIEEVAPGLVEFRAGGILTGAIAKGLAEGRPHGNPRFKGLLEAFHGTLKNELGNVRGLIGGGRGAEPEDAYGLDKRDNALRAMALALEQEKPGILDRLRLPYMPYADFMQLVGDAYLRLDNRDYHHMEGWSECGFVRGEFQPTIESGWIDYSALDKMPVDIADAYRRGIKAGTIAYRTRNLSPAEAWTARCGELKRLDPIAATIIMGEGLARHCICDDRLQLAYKDPSTERSETVAGVIDGGGVLDRGAEYMVWINPLSPGRAYIADAVGRFLGTAAVMQRVTYGDDKAVEQQLGIRQRALAEERKRLAPLTRKRQADEAEAARINAIEILGYDPAVSAHIARPKQLGKTGASVDDLIRDEAESAPVQTMDDFI